MPLEALGEEVPVKQVGNKAVCIWCCGRFPLGGGKSQEVPFFITLNLPVVLLIIFVKASEQF